jgi:hypothetical protein
MLLSHDQINGGHAREWWTKATSTNDKETSVEREQKCSHSILKQKARLSENKEEILL